MGRLICVGLVMVILCQGCAVAALTAASAYAVSSIKAKNTEQKKAYDDYKLEMEKINIERVKAGMETLPIKSFEEWSK